MFYLFYFCLQILSPWASMNRSSYSISSSLLFAGLYRITVIIYKGPLQDPNIFKEGRPSTAAFIFIQQYPLRCLRHSDTCGSNAADGCSRNHPAGSWTYWHSLHRQQTAAVRSMSAAVRSMFFITRLNNELVRSPPVPFACGWWSWKFCTWEGLSHGLNDGGISALLSWLLKYLKTSIISPFNLRNVSAFIFSLARLSLYS